MQTVLFVRLVARPFNQKVIIVMIVTAKVIIIACKNYYRAPLPDQ